ncbi:MAG: glycosyl hydrolase, partial [Bdellovibrionota bacterium]|nr:glycosyl hydrolase [Bdellovibrionota bacterium]
KCKLGESGCNTQKLIKVVRGTLEKLQGKARPKWLMGANEPWNKAQANLPPWEAVEIWRKYLQPAADKLKLKLMSPNFTEKEDELEWMANFLKHCSDFSKDKTYPCDLGKIKAFGIHTYKCKDSHWNKHYGRGDKIRKTLKLKMASYGGKSKKFWGQYISKRKFWVTETNCNWDGDAPSSLEQCRRITGRRKRSHGMGSINHMMKNDKIEGFAWWHTYNENQIQRALNSRLSYKGGTLKPVGRGYLRPNNKTNCKW